MANDYFKYKQHEATAFGMLFPLQSHTDLTARQIFVAAKKAIQSLDGGRLQQIDCHLRESIQLREKHALRFRSSPLRQRRGHEFWNRLIQKLIDAVTDTRSERELQRGVESGGDVAAEPEEDALSAHEAAFLRFLEDLNLCVNQIEAHWRRAMEGELGLSAAAMCLCPFHALTRFETRVLTGEVTNTNLCVVQSMIYAEMILNPAWFRNGCLAVSIAGDSFSAFWDELQACASGIGLLFRTAIEPIFRSQTPVTYAPLVSRMLIEGMECALANTLLNTPLVSALAASVATRCLELGFPLDELRASVRKQIASTKTVLRRLPGAYENASIIRNVWLRMETVEVWAAACQDAVSFGQMTSWLQIQHILATRLFVYENSLLQLFAYPCERVRLNGTPLPSVLDELFNDRRLSPFLFLDSRPKTLDDC
ncbi:hypothetical protein DM02DRAFT_664303 [Periconia macrospinosa]|uniref:Uncharacterized protein n=1 Tax=Periconia macrospinosa TaxID=97972 RepID=A0A2V1CZE4_9PLEO|nr:hypothetical protein DM02DRAFT_664303 [Periconia macrospinosa]